jgi:hypothetical protein
MKLEGHLMAYPVLDDFTCPVTIMDDTRKSHCVGIDAKAAQNDQDNLNHLTLLCIHLIFLTLL